MIGILSSIKYKWPITMKRYSISLIYLRMHIKIWINIFTFIKKDLEFGDNIDKDGGDRLSLTSLIQLFGGAIKQ